MRHPKNQTQKERPKRWCRTVVLLSWLVLPLPIPGWVGRTYPKVETLGAKDPNSNTSENHRDQLETSMIQSLIGLSGQP